MNDINSNHSAFACVTLVLALVAGAAAPRRWAIATLSQRRSDPSDIVAKGQLVGWDMRTNPAGK